VRGKGPTDDRQGRLTMMDIVTKAMGRTSAEADSNPT
jgi:hypothetical protein